MPATAMYIWGGGGGGRHAPAAPWRMHVRPSVMRRVARTCRVKTFMPTSPSRCKPTESGKNAGVVQPAGLGEDVVQNQQRGMAMLVAAAL